MEELAPLQWNQEQIAAFLNMQFTAQHSYYTNTYQDASFQIILVDNQPAGRLYVHRRKNEIRIVDIAILPEYRSRGIGSYFLRMILDEGQQTHRPVTIHVEQHNPAMRLYCRLGFRKIGEAGIYYLMEKQPEIDCG